MLRSVTIAVAVCAAAYGGYWVFAQNTAKTATQNAIAQAEAMGYDISYSDLSVRGFPSRIDQTATDLSVTMPDGVSGIDLPFLKLFALSYQPNKVIAVLPQAFTLRAGNQPIAVTNDDLRGRVDVGFDLSLPLQSAVAEGDNLRFATQNFSLTAESFLAALRPNPQAAPVDHPYDLYAELKQITLPDDVIARVDPAGALPAVLEGVRIDGVATFADPLTLNTPPVLTGITLRDAVLTWGDTSLGVTGTLAPDAQYRATGTVEVSLRNWPALLRLATDAGVVSAEYEGIITQALQLFGRGQATLTAPITLADGQMRLGFLPLGPAPILPFTLPR